MSDLDIDEILRRLSIKFNRIVYDRDFVECVREDLQTIIVNHEKCCVLVFPTLSPNYLRLVRYQAKLCDLAVISLGSRSAKSVAVCHKKHFLPDTTEENLCSIQMAENSSSATRKKRPPIQLYVPPAQRNLPAGKRKLSTIPKESIVNVEVTVKNGKQDTNNKTRCSEVPQRIPQACNSQVEDQTRRSVSENICYSIQDIGIFWDLKKIRYKSHVISPEFDDQCNCVKFSLLKDLLPYSKLLIFDPRIVVSSNRSRNVVFDCAKLKNWTTLNAAKHKSNRSITRYPVVVQNVLDFRENLELPDVISEFQNKLCWFGNGIFLYLPDFNRFYLPVAEFQSFNANLEPEEYLQLSEDQSYLGQYTENLVNYKILDRRLEIEISDLDILIASISTTEFSGKHMQENTLSNCDSKVNDPCAKNNEENSQQVSKHVNEVLVLDERIEPPKIGSENTESVRCKNKYNRHEEEKEIMRMAKKNMNRKTRSIIKYAEERHETLSIGTGDNVNNWEDLFNDDGELQDDFFTEIIEKVGQEVTIVKASEDYSAYASKQIEELEHMVELYDFPDTFKTHDIISNFNEIKSDSMYVKWLDDTRALLVLGSSSQAQKALKLSNELIKVRPMSAASNLALEKANQCDLKPAMKRPQTNLQTARRLITSHLGAKTKVSKEQNAREKEDLRVAKELKKQTRQNEKDAWEGNLRSSLN